MQASLLKQKSFPWFLDRMTTSLSGSLKDTGRKFSDSRKRVLTYIYRAVLKNVSRLTFTHYYTYDTITLKLFVDIVNTGEFERVARSKVYDFEKCFLIWEQILITNSKMEGSNKLGITFNSFKAYIRYSAIFVMVNALLTKLQIVVDREAIKTLAGLGYRISPFNYNESIKEAFNKLSNVNSKIESKQKELQALVGNGETQSHGLNFGAMIAEASAAIGFRVGDGVLLSEYNQYIKLIRAKK